MRWLAAIALGVFLLTAVPAAAFELTILHSNDVHGRLAPTLPFGSECTPAHKAENKCLGGAARMANAVAAVRAEGGPVLLLDAGDQFQGTLFYTHYKGQAAVQVMNRLGYDAMAVGNHEFDDGPETLARFAAAAHFPLLAANMDVSADPTLAGKVAPWVVLNAGGEKIGVIGLITEETPSISSTGDHIRFVPLAGALRRAVAELEAEGIDKIVALGHVGYWRNIDLARTVAGADIIVGGHSHTYLLSDDSAAAGPYPTVARSPRSETVLIVQAYQ